MPKPPCFVEGCEKITHARRLCSAHYQQGLASGTIDIMAPNPSGPCGQCGGVIPVTRRWGAKYCSTTCKDAALGAKKQQAIVASRGSARTQKCAWCDTDLSDRRFGVRFCGRKCNDDWQNHQKSIVVLQAKKAARRKCQVCEKPIPPAKSTLAIYCTYKCKTQAGRSVHPDVKQKRLDYNREYLYGLTPADVDQMVAEQGGQCAICRNAEPRGKGYWHVDHDHKTGVIRGLLCHYCNLGLGKFKDNPVSLRAAADYLERAANGPLRRIPKAA